MTSAFSNITDILSTFTDEYQCLSHLEKLRWNDNVISPFDAYSKVYKCKSNRYRCKNTGKYFNAKTGTIFHNSKIEMRLWFAAIWLFSNSPKITSTQLGKELGLTQKTAWFMRKKIKFQLRNGMFLQTSNKPNLNHLSSSFEVQEKRNVSEWLQLIKK